MLFLFLKFVLFFREILTLISVFKILLTLEWLFSNVKFSQSQRARTTKADRLGSDFLKYRANSSITKGVFSEIVY